jgi:hypothetical protein
MHPKSFFGELKQPNVYKIAVAYGVVGWLLVQVATQVFPFFEIPNWGIRLVVLTPALLRLDPDRDNLRGDARFEQLCKQQP